MTLKSAASAALALLLAAAAPPGRAETRPGPPSLRLALAYDGKLYIKVLDMHVDQTVAPTGFGASIAMRSYGVLAAFKHFDIQAASQGRIEAGEVRPYAFDYTNHDGKRVRHVTATWGEGDVRMTSTPPFSNLGDPAATPAQKIAAADPLTQLVRLMLTPPGHAPCAGASRYFDGKQLYELDLTPAGAGALSGRAHALGLVNPLRCTLLYREVAGFKRKPPSKRNQGLESPVHVTFGQLGAGGPWVIADLEADTKLGPAHIELADAHMTESRP
jgi:hypothetical protein